MSVREIVQLGNPLLWEKSAPVEDVRTAHTASLIRDLDDTLKDFRKTHGFGRGIAAPQIGVLKRVIFVRMQPAGFEGALINPKIILEDQRREERWDDCFSFPGLMVRVSRAAYIEVNYIDEAGHRQHLKADGDLAELLQHEIDHLDGILIIDRAVSPKAFATRKEWLRMQREQSHH